MNEEQLRAFLILLMCSDPWPVKNEQGNQQILKSFADKESQWHGYADWIGAYHALSSKGGSVKR